MAQSDEDRKSEILAEFARYGGRGIPKSDSSPTWKIFYELADELNIPRSNVKNIIASDDIKFAQIRMTLELMLSPSGLELMPLSEWRTIVKHEIWHSKQIIQAIGTVEKPTTGMSLSALLYAIGSKELSAIVRDSQFDNPKILECEADFAAGNGVAGAAMTSTKTSPAEYNGDGWGSSAEHPSYRSRIKSSLAKAFMESYSGIALEPDDVRISDDCSFSVKGLETADAKMQLANKMAGRDLQRRYEKTGQKFSADEFTSLVEQKMNALNKLTPEALIEIRDKVEVEIAKIDVEVKKYDALQNSNQAAMKDSPPPAKYSAQQSTIGLSI